MSQSSSLVVPIVLWGKDAPTHSITAMAIAPDLNSIVTGCQDAQIIIWDIRTHTQPHTHPGIPSPVELTEGQDEEGEGGGGVSGGGLCTQPCWDVSAFLRTIRQAVS